MNMYVYSMYNVDVQCVDVLYVDVQCVDVHVQ